MLKGETKRSVKKILWKKVTIEAFEAIKNYLSEETIRPQPNFNRQFISTTDASDHAYGGILSQIDNNSI